MKSRWMVFALTGLFFALSAGSANAQSGTGETPPVAQSLVREGDFAMKLVETLHMGSLGSEAEAESALGSVGIAPKNGWIADYPVTPDILSELRDAVGEAADSGRLSMNKDDSLTAFQNLAAESGLPVVSDTGSGDRAKEPEKNYSQYTDPAIINNYYYDQGPPAVTYYPPPWDYYYLYSWVPYPFWWHTFWFPGFFILHDFHRVVIVKRNVFKVVTNHVFDRGRGRVVTVNHAARTSGTFLRAGGGTIRVRDRNFSESQRGAASIMERSRERSGISSSGTSLGRDGDGASGPTRTDRRIERGRVETDPSNSGTGSFRRPDNSGSREAPRSFRSQERRGSEFSAPPHFERRAFGSSSGSSRFSPSVNSGGRREMTFQGSSPGIDRSFRAPSFGGRGSGEGFRGGGRSGSGRFVGVGSSGRSCRGRC